MEANHAGLGMVFQEQSLIVNLNVAQNIFFGHEKQFKKNGLVNWGQMNRAAQQVLAEVDVTDISPPQKGVRPQLRHPPDDRDRQGHQRHQSRRAATTA